MKKKGYSALEVVITAILLTILLLVLLSITIPQLKKTKDFSKCPESTDVLCVEKSEGYTRCRQGGVMTEFDCDKGKVCCQLTAKETEIRRTTASQTTMTDCLDDDGKVPNVQCYCYNDDDDLDFFPQDTGLDDFGYVSKHCTGSGDTFLYDAGVKVRSGNNIKTNTKYCMNVEDHPDAKAFVKNHYSATWDDMKTYYCFEKSPLVAPESLIITIDEYTKTLTDSINVEGMFYTEDGKFDKLMLIAYCNGKEYIKEGCKGEYAFMCFMEDAQVKEIKENHAGKHCLIYAKIIDKDGREGVSDKKPLPIPEKAP